MSKCKHDFQAEVDINILKDSGRYHAKVTIKCKKCGPFRFLGLPPGLDLNGAAVSLDGTEAQLAVAPQNEVLSSLDNAPQGFTLRKK